MKRYQDFVAGVFSDPVTGDKPAWYVTLYRRVLHSNVFNGIDFSKVMAEVNKYTFDVNQFINASVK